MRTLFGKEVLETLGELVEPRHTALVIVDAQDVGHGDPACVRPDRDNSMVQEMLPRLGSFVYKARSTGLVIAWVRNTNPLEGEGGASLGIKPADNLIPRPGDMVVKKTRPNGFFGTGLDILLRQRGIKTVITTGITTEGCVDATALGADHLDFYSVVAEDCVASFNSELHDDALAILRYRCECALAKDIAAGWPQRR